MPDSRKSLAMQERAKRRIPGMTQLLSKRPDLFSLGVWPGYYDTAEGAHITDLDGNRYLDMSIAGIGANVLGYADPEVDEAVTAAIRKGASSSLNCPEEVELADLLCELHPWAQMVRYTRAGGEAMAMAVRIARAATGRDQLAICGYHGWHDWYLAANLGTENALGQHLIAGLSPVGVPKGLTGTVHAFGYNQLGELEAIVERHGKSLAAIVMEPLRDSEPAPGFIEGARALADKTGAVLVMDEVSAGLRFCTGGAHLVKHSVTPDMAVFSKALGNGYSISAVIGTESVMQATQKTFISSTNWTERVGPTAAIATLRKHRRESVGEHLVTLGERVQRGWVDAAIKHGLKLHAGGMKPMSHFAFEDGDPLAMKAYFVQAMLEHGILASNLFYAMHAHTFEHVDRYLDAVDTVFARMAKLGPDGVVGQLKGQPSVAGFKRLA